jgi:hypothetical protein
MGRATKLVDAAQAQFNPIREDSIEYLTFEAIRNLDRRLEALEPKKPKKEKRGTAGR